MTNHIITRAANKSRHPGTPDLPAPRRSSQIIQEERAVQNAVHMAARLQQEEYVQRVADIEDQLHKQMKTQRTNFQNPTSAMTRSWKPQSKPKTAPDGVIVSPQTSRGVLGHGEDDGESEGVETEKVSDTETKAVYGKGDYYDAVAMEGSEGEETVVIRKKPAKVSRQIIEAARTTKAAKPEAKAIASIPPTTGKRKLHREGAVFFGPSTQKKTKCDQPSGLTSTYQRLRKEGRPVDTQHEPHTGIEAQTGEHATSTGDQVDTGVTDRFGGLSDDSVTSKKDKGWQPARAQSTTGPLAITKIVANAPQQCLQASAPIASATCSKNRPSHQNLPDGSSAQFTRFLVPLLRLYCGTQENPWMVSDQFLNKLQELWDAVMLDWPHWFDEDDNVYRLCMQKTYEWCAHIGKAGIEAVEALWASDPKYENPEERKAYVDFALGPSLPFMYGSVKHLGGNEYSVSKSFLSSLVLRTFASHIRDTSAVDNDTYHKLIDYAMPRGALVLAVTSVERALTLYSTGVKEVPSKRSEASFSDIGWGTKTLLYTQSIMKVGNKKFDRIVSGARGYCGTTVRSRQAQVSYDASTAGDVNMDDDRALIAVSSDIEAELDGEGKHFESSCCDCEEAKRPSSWPARELERGLIR
ncbi:hypothetical protein J3R83DRAFT_9629 [Lanmaoa asiatica]|nr:hypothetical protein J3R83DRAFT_9629 [Lanmaoa asiatica]